MSTHEIVLGCALLLAFPVFTIVTGWLLSNAAGEAVKNEANGKGTR